MDTHIVVKNWQLFLAKAKEEWTELTEDDLKEAEAGRDHLVGIIEARYHRDKILVLQEVQDLWDKFEAGQDSKL